MRGGLVGALRDAADGGRVDEGQAAVRVSGPNLSRSEVSLRLRDHADFSRDDAIHLRKLRSLARHAQRLEGVFGAEPSLATNLGGADGLAAEGGASNNALPDDAGIHLNGGHERTSRGNGRFLLIRFPCRILRWQRISEERDMNRIIACVVAMGVSFATATAAISEELWQGSQIGSTKTEVLKKVKGAKDTKQRREGGEYVGATLSSFDIDGLKFRVEFVFNDDKLVNVRLIKADYRDIEDELRDFFHISSLLETKYGSPRKDNVFGNRSNVWTVGNKEINITSFIKAPNMPIPDQLIINYTALNVGVYGKI